MLRLCVTYRRYVMQACSPLAGVVVKYQTNNIMSTGDWCCVDVFTFRRFFVAFLVFS